MRLTDPFTRGAVHRRAVPLLAAAIACLGGPALAQADAGKDETPWRLREAIGSPRWLKFGLEHRSRFEHLANDFRSTSTGDATALSLRTLISTELRFDPVVIGAEIQDSRAYAPVGTPLNATIVDPLELLQAYVGVRVEGVLREGDRLSASFGRLTMDVGSRRLVARNEFRNTINGFTGLDVKWTSSTRHVARMFAVLPVVRLPSDAASLAENKVQLDKENTDSLFLGALYGSPVLFADTQLEAYAFGLLERDGAVAQSSDRRLVTPGFRLLRPPAKGRFDFQLEAMLQLGKSRATAAPADTSDLAHLAFSGHVSSGYRFDAPWTPRFALQYDYASGDASPDDHANNRFDPLFGARRFDFGPTGLYGALARSNISSPGARLEMTPHRTVEAFVGYRLAWLAAARDAWTTAGLRDPSGASGTFVGQQIEGRVRWQPLPKNLSLELGAAYLVRGEFAKEAPGARSAPAAFVYTQVTGTI